MFGNHKMLDHPFVAALARMLWEQKAFKDAIKQDPERFKRAAAVGLLLEFFQGPKSREGNFLPGLTEEKIDQLAGVPGFGKALGLTGLVNKETFPRSGMQAHDMESWFDPEAAQLLCAIYGWWEQNSNGASAPMGPLAEPALPSPSRSRPGKSDGCPEFETLWQSYPAPQRIDKQGCLRKYLSIIEGGVTHEDVFDGLVAWLRSEQWIKDGGKFVPHLATWLNQRRWEAKPSPATPSAEKQAAPPPSDDEVRRRREEMAAKIVFKRGGSKPHDLNGHSRPPHQDEGGEGDKP